MRNKVKLVYFSSGTIALILLMSSIGFNILWNKILYFHASQVSEQIKINLVKELSEGNLFEISASLGRLKMSNVFSEAALVEYSKNKTEWLYSSNNNFKEQVLLDVDFLSSCEKSLVQIPNKEFILIRTLLKSENSSDAKSITCAITKTKIPSDLNKVHTLVIYIFSIISLVSIAGLVFFIVRLGNQELFTQKELAKKEIQFASKLAEIAQQVSHDIRSPLSALNMMLVDLKELPEQKRVIVRSALQRINDISNSLLEKSKGQVSPVHNETSIPAKSSTSLAISASADNYPHLFIWRS